MADNFATIDDDLRLIEAVMERAINDEPLFDEDVPPIPCKHISIAVDAMGPFANPFAAAAAADVDAAPAIDAKATDAKVSSIPFSSCLLYIQECKMRGAPGAPPQKERCPRRTSTVPGTPSLCT